MKATGLKVLKTSGRKSNARRRAADHECSERTERAIDWSRSRQLRDAEAIPPGVERGFCDIASRSAEENEKEKMSDDREPQTGRDVNSTANRMKRDVPAQSAEE